MKSQMFGMLVFVAAHSLLAQTHAIKSYTFGGGGASSAGNRYAVKGTIGQPDAGRQRGAVYAVSGGFWSVAAVIASDDSPTLRILPAGRNVILAWPTSAAGFQLQQSPSLIAPMWTDVPTPPRVVGAETQVIMQLHTGSQFFRLRREESR